MQALTSRAIPGSKNKASEPDLQAPNYSGGEGKGPLYTGAQDPAQLRIPPDKNTTARTSEKDSRTPYLRFIHGAQNASHNLKEENHKQSNKKLTRKQEEEKVIIRARKKTKRTLMDKTSDG